MSQSYRAPTTRRYSPEFKERAVRMVRQLRAETGERKGTIGRVVAQLGCGVESLRAWAKRAEVDSDRRDAGLPVFCVKRGVRQHLTTA